MLEGADREPDRQEHQAVLRRRAVGPQLPEVPATVYETLRLPGHPLDPATRRFMEGGLGRDFTQVRAQSQGADSKTPDLSIGPPNDRFEQEADRAAQRFLNPSEGQTEAGHDFSSVRIHSDAQAAASAQAVDAQAYTVGSHIVLGPGQYAPATVSGRQLLAHELAHVLQQAPGVLRRRGQTCPRRYTRARNFRDYISLVREAETRLSAAGYSTAEDRVHVLRGIYYGTTWSADYRSEHSPVRNLGFQVYTASTAPDDPRAILNCGLFEALRDSQDLSDGRRHVDVGHLMIGLDARRSWTPRHVSIPSQGGTGLDISTWLGDLGGGAGMLAYHRVRSPTTRAVSVFRGTDFGGSINLEGDVAGFVVARDTSATPSEPSPLVVARGGTVADALQAYLLPVGGGRAARTEWSNRCQTFMRMMGATFNASGALSNRTSLEARLAGQIQDFACWYLVNRLRQTGRLSLSTLRSASLHVGGASEEVAEVFVDALDRCRTTPGSRLEAHGAGPSPKPAGSSAPTPCALAIHGIEAAEHAGRIIQEGEHRLEQWRRLLPF